jgi:hypothetical protein
VRALAAAPLDRVLERWSGLGYYRALIICYGAEGDRRAARRGRSHAMPNRSPPFRASVGRLRQRLPRSRLAGAARFSMATFAVSWRVIAALPVFPATSR